MLMHHTLDCANSWLNPESHWLVNGSFLLTESFCKNYLFSVTSLWCTLVSPFVVVHLTHILSHPRVHRAHRLKCAGIQYSNKVAWLSLTPQTVVIFGLLKRNRNFDNLFNHSVKFPNKSRNVHPFHKKITWSYIWNTENESWYHVSAKKISGLGSILSNLDLEVWSNFSSRRRNPSGDSKEGLRGPWLPQFFLNFPFKFVWLTYIVDNFRSAIF